MSITDRRPVCRRRWVKWTLTGLLAIVLGLVVGLPWLLGLPPAQRLMAARANAILAPGSIEFGAIRLSWFRPTEISRFVLRDAQGESVLASPHAIFEWSLGQILFRRPQSGRLTFDRGELDIERFADGTVDLYETLRPIMEVHPRWRKLIHVANARLRFRDPALADPVLADPADIELDLGRGNDPVTWKVALIQSKRDGAAGELAIVGTQSREQVDSTGNHDVTVLLKGSHWPWAVTSAGVQSRGDFDGTIEGRRHLGTWEIAGDATFPGLQATVAALGSDTVHLEWLRGVWKLVGHDRTWYIDQIDLKSPLGWVRAEGSFPPNVKQGAWFEGSVDVAALCRQLPKALPLREGLRLESGLAQFRLDARVQPPGPAETWSVRGSVSDLVASEGTKRLTITEPATIEAVLSKQQSGFGLDRFEVQTPFLKATGRGDVDSGVCVGGTLDLAAFSARFRDWIDLGSVEPAGVCKLDVHYQRKGPGYDATATGELRNVRVGGLPLLGTFERDQMLVSSAVRGGADPAGWPLDWRQWSLRAKSGDSDLDLKGMSGGPSQAVFLEGRGVARVALAGQSRRAEAELKLTWDRHIVTAPHLSLALMSDSAWGPGLGPGGTTRWAGRGRFDLARDELVLESAPGLREASAKADPAAARPSVVKVRGLKGFGAAPIEAEASADLGDLSGLLAAGDQSWTGRLDGRAHLRRERDLWNLGFRLELHDPARVSGAGARVGLDGAIMLGVEGLYSRALDQLRVSELAFNAPFVQVDGAGVVNALSATPQLDLKGSLSPDWSAISAALARSVEPNAHVAGKPRAWRVSGALPGDLGKDALAGLDGICGIELDELDVFGMRLGGATLAVRVEDGQVKIDPIDSTLNGGALHLEPELARREDGSIWLRLGRSSSLQGAVVNDEVSHRVLSYVAPVLDGATRVRGKVSLTLEEALIPLWAEAGASEKINGDMLFDEVRFMPGPLANELLGIFLREDRPLLVLRDPVSVRIAGGKIYQHGLVIPVAKVAAIGLEGSVDFHKNLDLVASIGMVPAGGGQSVLAPVVRNARIEIPIRGTLDHPKIDADAFTQRLKSIGKDLLETSMEAGVDTWQKLLKGLPALPFRGLFPPARRDPPQPNQPPPPPGARPPGLGDGQEASRNAQTKTSEDRRLRREERKQQRLEKKAQRQLRRQQPPEPSQP
jgi:translocation and assembly module TamB